MITIRRNHTDSMRSTLGHPVTGKNWKRALATALVLTSAVAIMPSMASAAAEGTLDTTFGTGGKVATTIGAVEEAKSVAVQTDGKIIVVGRSGVDLDSGDFAIARYNTDGSLDDTFDGDGKTTVDIGTTDVANSVAIQSDGKIIVVGQSKMGMSLNAIKDFAILRFNTNGTLDADFDGDGKATTDIGSSTSDTANSVAIQSNGKIIVAGQSGYDFAVVRYNTNGTLDTDFDGDGKATTDIGTSSDDSGNSVAIQSNGKIIVGGNSNNDFTVVRYNTNGTLDTDFDGDGKATADIGSNTSDTAYSMTIQSDGKILVAGVSASNFAVVRYNTNGTLDTDFDGDTGTSNGKITTDIGSNTADTAKSVALQSDGKIVIAGSTGTQYTDNFAVARYNTNGTLDTNFGTGGKTITDIGTNTNDDGTSVAIQSDGQILIAGTSPRGPASDFALVRYVGTPVVAPTTTTITTTTTIATAATTTTVAATVAAPTTTIAPTTTTTTLPVSLYASAVPGITVTDTKVYQTAPKQVAGESAIMVLTAAQNKVADVVSKTPSVCLPSDNDLVFIDEGRCIAEVVNTKTRQVLRTLKTTVVADDISKLEVGNEIAILTPLYFVAGTFDLKAQSLSRLTKLKDRVTSAGSVLVAGHSGVLMGNTPENVKLAKARADATVKILKSRGAKGPFAVTSVGALDPVTTVKTQAAQEKNRRVVIVLIP